MNREKKLKLRRRDRCRELRADGKDIQPRWPKKWKRKRK